MQNLGNDIHCMPVKQFNNGTDFLIEALQHDR